MSENRSEIVMYTTRTCVYCVAAKLVLGRNKLAYTEVDVSAPDKRAWLMHKTGRRTVPQIYIGDYHVGGHHELRELERSGQLLERVGVAG